MNHDRVTTVGVNLSAVDSHSQKISSSFCSSPGLTEISGVESSVPTRQHQFPCTVSSIAGSTDNASQIATTATSNSSAIVVTYPNSQSERTITKYTAVSILSRYTQRDFHSCGRGGAPDPSSAR